MKFLTAFFCFFLINIFAFSQNIFVEGYVSFSDLKPADKVEISTADKKIVVFTDSSGHFSVSVNATQKKLFFYKESYKIYIADISGETVNGNLNVKLIPENELDVINVIGNDINSAGTVIVDPKISQVMPSVTEGIESLIKMQAGVAGSRSELSSQYSVRGGNYDENLVYVNGIEIYRPQLIRSGEQEGLSFINPEMVETVNFSAGGFEAKYGDKSASVLDIKYKQPDEFKASASVGLFGVSFFLQSAFFSNKLKILSGLRTKKTQYMLNGLETSGEYNPSFTDFQNLISFDFNKKFSVSFLTNISTNKFNFVPESRKTNFGSINRAYGFYVLFNGQEADVFNSLSGALIFNYNYSNNTAFSLSLSGITAQESEKFDIIAAYSINELNRDFDPETAGDSLLNLGTGLYINHARNNLDINILSSEFKARHNLGNHLVNWAVKYKYEYINGKTDEWQMLDSAGYSVPYDGNKILLYKNVKSDNTIHNHRIETYFQDKLNIKTYNGKLEIIAGFRISGNTFATELFLSPRFSLGYKPDVTKYTVYRFSAGVYNQPVFYKETQLFDGSFSNNLKAQNSYHFVLGNDFKFSAIGRTLYLKTEIYYKILHNIIPFEVDNVRVRYYANQRANGYVVGIDSKIAGEFVPGVDSWLSLSLMKTAENIYDIGNGIDDGYSYIPRPTDQRVTASLFLQDYIPGNNNFRAHLNLLYSTGFYFGPPEKGREYALYKSPDYKRVDLGASAVIVDENKKSNKRILKNLSSFLLTVEVLNMLDVENTISYNWLRVVPNTANPSAEVYEQYAVPNHLTSIRLNVKLLISF